MTPTTREEKMTTKEAIEQAKELIEQCKWPERILPREKLKGKAKSLLEFYERADKNIEALQHLIQVADRARDAKGIEKVDKGGGLKDDP